MKKIYCPRCKFKWREGDRIEFTVKSYEGSPYNPRHICHISKIKIENLIFCPICYFKGITSTHEERVDPDVDLYRCQEERVVLRKDNVELTHVVILDEFGDYIDMPIKNLIAVGGKISGFGYDPDSGDDHTSVWGGAGPDCISGRLAAA